MVRDGAVISVACFLFDVVVAVVLMHPIFHPPTLNGRNQLHLLFEWSAAALVPTI